MSPRWFPDNEVRIDASPLGLVLRDDVDEVRVPATVWVTLDGNFVAVNDRPPESPWVVRVEIFKPSPWDPVVSRSELLRRLLGFGLTRFVEGVMFKVRPVVRFGPLACFGPILCGFQRDLFEWAAINAGAREVRFDVEDVVDSPLAASAASASMTDGVATPQDSRWRSMGATGGHPGSRSATDGMDYWRQTFGRLNRNLVPR